VEKPVHSPVDKLCKYGGQPGDKSPIASDKPVNKAGITQGKVAGLLCGYGRQRQGKTVRDPGMSRWIWLCTTGGVAVEIPEFPSENRHGCAENHDRFAAT
jgi:hypothetical protein